MGRMEVQHGKLHIEVKKVVSKGVTAGGRFEFFLDCVCVP